MDPKHKIMLEKLQKEIVDNTSLTKEERQKKLDAIETATKVVSSLKDYKGDYSNISDTPNIELAQKETQDHIREEFNNVIRKEAEAQGKNFNFLLVKSGEPKFAVNEGLADAKKNVLDKYEFKISEDFKAKVLKIAAKMEEYGINNPAYGGETGSKVYALYKFKEIKEQYIDAVDKGDLDKLVELKPQYDLIMNHYKELLDMALDLSHTEVVDNMDIAREQAYPPELWYREIAASNLNAVFQGIAYCKNRNIDYNEYIENPYRFFKENLDKTWLKYKEEVFLPKTEKLSTRLAKIIEIQTSEERSTDYSGEIGMQSAFAGRSIELFQKLDKGEGLEGRSLYSAYTANAASIYSGSVFFTNYLDAPCVEGLKNVFLIGDKVDNLAELDSRFIDPITLEMNKYPYRESLKTAELSDDFVEKTVKTAIDTFFEAKQMQEEMDGEAGPVIDGDKLLYTVTSLFHDILMERDLSANPKLAKSMMDFCKTPTKIFSRIGMKNGHPGLDALNLFNEVYTRIEKEKVTRLPNPTLAVGASRMRNAIGNIFEKNTISKSDFEIVFTQLKTIQLEQKYTSKPSILHPFKRKDWNRNNTAMTNLKNGIYAKLSEFGVKSETMDELLRNPEKANAFISGMEKYSLINAQKIKDTFDKAFDKGTLDDLTPEQKAAYESKLPSDELIEAQTILKGNRINEKNLTTAVELLKELKDAGNSRDIQNTTEYIFSELRGKGLSDETLRNTVNGEIEISSYIGEFEEEKSIVFDLDDEDFDKKLKHAINDGEIIDLDEPVNEKTNAKGMGKEKML